MYKKELDAIQRWIYAVAGLTSMRLTQAPPKVARPIILWQASERSKDRNISRYQYVNRVVQYGKLYVNSLDELNDLEYQLLNDIEEKLGVLSVFDDQNTEIAKLKAVEVTFDQSNTLDVPIRIEYEATYGRTRPAQAPSATAVFNKRDTKF